MDTVEQKKQLRKQIKLIKKELSAEDSQNRSTLVFDEVEKMEQFQKSKNVLAFWSLPDEVCTHNFVTKWAKHKNMLLPVMVGEGLEVRAFTGFEAMNGQNSFGVMEPTTGRLVNPADVEFAIIPGVAFDHAGNRLGRGKGFYDRLMPNLSNALTVGVCYAFQIVDSIPVAKFDIPVDIVIGF